MSTVRKALQGMVFSSLSMPVWAAGVVYIPLPPLEADESQIQIEAVAPLGQSFMPTESSVGSIWLRARNMNLDFPMHEDKWLTLNLHAGDGFAGPVLATATVNVEAVIGSLIGDEGLIEFSFGHVPVVSGQVYSFEVKAATARYGINWQHTDWYGGGHAFALGGPLTITDLYFSVAAAAVPEPASYALMAAGASLLPWLRRRLSPSRG